MDDVRVSSFAASFAERAGYPRQQVSEARGFVAALQDIREDQGAVPAEFSIRANRLIASLTEEAQRFEHRGGVLAGQESGDIDDKVSIVESGLKEIDRTIHALKQHIAR